MSKSSRAPRAPEMGFGWALVSIGVVIVLAYGGWNAVRSLVSTSELPLVVRAGILALLAGLAVLFVSVVRQRLAGRKEDPYKDVDR
ncbi:MAG: hypothetical protein ACE5HF_10870 [Gemmatimonadota bacterium]